MMMFDMAKMMKQAKDVQDKMMKIQDELASTEMQGKSDDGNVEVTCSGKFDNWQVTINPSLNGDTALIQAGVQQALVALSNTIMNTTQDKMSSLTKGLNIPGLKLPF